MIQARCMLARACPVPGAHDIVVHNKGKNTVPKGKKIVWTFGNRGVHVLAADLEPEKDVSIANALPDGPVAGTSCKATRIPPAAGCRSGFPRRSRRLLRRGQ